MEVCLPTDKDKSEMTFEERLKKDFERMNISTTVFENEMKRNPMFFMFHEAFIGAIRSQESTIRALLTNSPIPGMDKNQLANLKDSFLKEMQIQYAMEK